MASTERRNKAPTQHRWSQLGCHKKEGENSSDARVNERYATTWLPFSATRRGDYRLISIGLSSNKINSIYQYLCEFLARIIGKKIGSSEPNCKCKWDVNGSLKPFLLVFLLADKFWSKRTVTI